MGFKLKNKCVFTDKLYFTANTAPLPTTNRIFTIPPHDPVDILLLVIVIIIIIIINTITMDS